ncbi:MAG: DUF3822 family protein [Brumimicrobium sp.]|nr:DUF3822 family protein [Brumimicrobium sp.]
MESIQLTIQISRTSVLVAEVLRSSQEIRSSKYLTFENTNPAAYKGQLDELLQSGGFTAAYDEVTLGWSSMIHSLVPMRVYNDTNASDLIRLLFGDAVEEGEPNFNRLAELNMVSVYTLPDWVKSFFVMRFPGILVKHEHAMTLRALFQGPTYKLKVVVSLCSTYMNIAIIEKNELKFSNAFEFQNEEDILYHLLYVLEQKGIKEEKGELLFIIESDSDKSFSEKTVKRIKEHSLLKNFDLYEPKKSILNQLLCV